MKKITWFILFVFLVVCQTSCTDWKDNDENEVYYQLFAFVTSNSLSPTFKTDDGSTLVTKNLVNSDSSTFYKTGDRVFIRFTLGDTTSSRTTKIYPIKLVNYAKSTVRDYRTVEADSADPYKDSRLYGLYAMWLSANYLDAVVKTYTSYNIVNTVELVRYKGEESNQQTDTVPTIHMQLRHNTVSVVQDSYTPKACTFDLSGLITEFPEARKFRLIISWNADSAYGNNSYTFTYTPVKTSTGSAGAAFFRRQSQWQAGMFSGF